MNTGPRWLGAHSSYTLSKYGMTLLPRGWTAEYAGERGRRLGSGFDSGAADTAHLE